MRKYILGALAVALLAGPAVANAGMLVEVSAGSGAAYDPKPVARIPTNIMVAPGYSFASMLKLELGVLGNLGDVKDSKFDLDLRPMVVVKPPLFPIYLRGIVGVTSLVDGPRKFTYGGALGMDFGALGVGMFLEAGFVPRRVEIPGGADQTIKVVEGRLGAYWD
jgi:hypothetical protein